MASRATMVPRIVDATLAATPTKMLFLAERRSASDAKSLRYQSSVRTSGGNVSAALLLMENMTSTKSGRYSSRM
jgi:hypothetical protein